MNKTAKVSQAVLINILVVCAVIAVGIVGYGLLFKDKPQAPMSIVQVGTQASGGATVQTQSGSAVSLTTTTCPDDKDTTLNIEVYNIGNESSSELVNTTVYLFKNNNGNLEKFATIIETIAHPDTTVDCGAQYVAKIISTGGASGDGSVIHKVVSGQAIVNSDSNIEFTTTGSSSTIAVGIYQHSIGQVRAYDNINKALIYDFADTSANDYETDGIVWAGTANNYSTYDETQGIDMEIELRAVQTDETVNDRGMLILVEAPASTWEKPTVYVNSQALTDIKGSGLTADEVKSYADYEYVFLVPQSIKILDAGDSAKIRWVMKLASGVASASADPEMDFATRGQFLSSIDGTTVKVGAVTDASSPAQVHTLFDMAVNTT